MKKLHLIGGLGALVLIFITYYFLVRLEVLNPVSFNNPSWVKDLIKKEKSGLATNPPTSLFKCIYNNQKVYYLPSHCCDFPSVVYDNKGNVICSPDGGFTGKGDGKCADFLDTKKNCVIVWEDKRHAK
ncbi:MAG: hypothetical protein ABIJ82_02740 [Patescibacteria group bacterium]|nr:hypothetical protein [Patescibacteria group bacterium]MBU1952604.1 hypothetical protein [Patescibacteria group bacterium]